MVKFVTTGMCDFRIDKVTNESVNKKFGWAWGKGGFSITYTTWCFMLSIIRSYEVKTVLEFGCGLSSLMMATEVEKVVAYETVPIFMRKIMGRAVEHSLPLEVHLWSGEDIEGLPCFDLCFVDGPRGGRQREHSIRLASEYANIVIVDDFARKFEKQFCEKYLGAFNVIGTGGMSKRGVLTQQVYVRKAIMNG